MWSTEVSAAPVTYFNHLAAQTRCPAAGPVLLLRSVKSETPPEAWFRQNFELARTDCRPEGRIDETPRSIERHVCSC